MTGGYVYLISDPDSRMVKIGRSVNPINRMAQIAPRGRGLELVSYVATANCIWLERFVHEAFSHRRVRGEWFVLTDEEVETFKQMVEVDDIDGIPPAMVASRVVNESVGFEWGRRDDAAQIPTSGRRMVGLPTALADAADDYAKSRYMTLTDVVREACLAYMRANGVGIPPGK